MGFMLRSKCFLGTSYDFHTVTFSVHSLQFRPNVKAMTAYFVCHVKLRNLSAFLHLTSFIGFVVVLILAFTPQIPSQILEIYILSILQTGLFHITQFSSIRK